ncbi:hypothetical protein [Clostridioides difficile]|uniref:hypothetical protein n=1 Tax=Clostridioides TaxID=1870884 RepID=UPI001024A3EA|nr:hypothetical protein [Clostridioides difficile]MCC0724140.1 hypothetical protein [Clostridioides sp. ZZV14-6104]MCC0739346.1 hypothetical protein [Clostridioides sp. ZZV14-5902]VFC48144.1 Uncharacterised protein [Clostridioides difficile]HEK8842933.1 hypothetical protein [Clostridioides difficile]
MGIQMPIMKRLRNDKELLELRILYKEKYNENAPGFNYDEYSSYEEYIEILKKLVKQ